MVKTNNTATNNTATNNTATNNTATNNLVNSINSRQDPNSISLTDLLIRAWERPEVPIAIVGNPGSGKTAQIENFCKTYNLPLVKVLASSMDETDVSGILVYDKLRDAAVLKRNELFLRLMERGGVLFLDEFNTARKEVADTLLTLIQSRELPGGYKLPLNTLIIAAMNDAQQCDNYELSPAMKNRFMWIKMTTKAKEWWAFLTGREKASSNPQAQLGEPLPMQEFYRWFQEPQNDVQRKAIMDVALKKNFEFSDDETIEEDQTFTTARSMTNLLYWTRDVQDFLFWAPAFINLQEAQLLRVSVTPALRNVANTVFKDGLPQVPEDETDPKELARLQKNAETLGLIMERRGLLNGCVSARRSRS